MLLGCEARLDVLLVEPRDDAVRRDGGALRIRDLEDAAGHLAPQHALLALDEARVVRGSARPAREPDGSAGRQHERDNRQDGPAIHAVRRTRRVAAARRSIPPRENSATCSASSRLKPRG